MFGILLQKTDRPLEIWRIKKKCFGNKTLSEIFYEFSDKF